MRLRMKQRRLELGLTQQQVADKAGIKRAHYSHIERGIRDLNLEQMESIAQALDIDFDGSFFRKNCDLEYHKASGQ